MARGNVSGRGGLTVHGDLVDVTITPDPTEAFADLAEHVERTFYDAIGERSAAGLATALAGAPVDTGAYRGGITIRREMLGDKLPVWRARGNVPYVWYVKRKGETRPYSLVIREGLRAAVRSAVELAARRLGR